MDLMIHLSDEASRRLQELADGDQRRAETIAETLLEQALDTMDRKALARVLLTQARERAATRPLNDDEWNTRFERVQEAILAEAVAKGTAIEGDYPIEDDLRGAE